MIEVEINAAAIEQIDGALWESQRKAANRAGYSASKQLEGQMKRLPTPKHPLSMLFKSGVQWRRVSAPNQSAFSSLAPFARHILYGASAIKLGFGYFRGTPRAKEARKFDKHMQGLVRGITKKREISVTPAMRKKLAATKDGLGKRVGIDYFPIRKTIKKLVIPARKIDQQPIMDELHRVFVLEFDREMKERL